MPPINTVVFLLGCALIVVAIVGGGVEVRELKIPPMRLLPRVLIAAFGVALMAMPIIAPQAFQVLGGSPASNSQKSNPPGGSSGSPSVTSSATTACQPQTVQEQVCEPAGDQPCPTDMTPVSWNHTGLWTGPNVSAMTASNECATEARPAAVQYMQQQCTGALKDVDVTCNCVPATYESAPYCTATATANCQTPRQDCQAAAQKCHMETVTKPCPQ